MNQQFEEPVFYVPGHRSILDVAMVGAAGEWIGMYCHKSLAELTLEHPGIQLGELEVVSKIRDLSCVTAPKLISAERYNDMFDALFPRDWVHLSMAESFKFGEFYVGNITTVFARRGNSITGDGVQYFEFYDFASIRHDDIMKKIDAAFPRTSVQGSGTKAH